MAWTTTSSSAWAARRSRDCDGDGTLEGWRGPSGRERTRPTSPRSAVGSTWRRRTRSARRPRRRPGCTPPTAPATSPATIRSTWAVTSGRQTLPIKVMRQRRGLGRHARQHAFDRQDGAHVGHRRHRSHPASATTSTTSRICRRLARIADRQVGQALGELEAQGIDDETLVVLTTDHAGQTADRVPRHRRAPTAATSTGTTVRMPMRPTLSPSPAIARARRRARWQRRLLLPGRTHRRVAG